MRKNRQMCVICIHWYYICHYRDRIKKRIKSNTYHEYRIIKRTHTSARAHAHIHTMYES